MNINTLLINLSNKLGDPIGSPIANGVIFSSQLRKEYLQRAYAGLIRILDKVAFKTNPSFTQRTKVEDRNTEVFNGLKICKIEGLIKVEEVIFTITPENVIKGSLADVKDWGSIISGINSFVQPTASNPFYCVFGNEIHFRPQFQFQKLTVTYLAEPIIDFSKNDIDVTTDYEDLLLCLACIEGMIDTNNPNKAKMYQELVMWHLNIISQFAQYTESKEQ